MSYHEGSNWQSRKEDEKKPLYENKPAASQPGVQGVEYWKRYAELAEACINDVGTIQYDRLRLHKLGKLDESPSLPPDGVQGLMEEIESYIKAAKMRPYESHALWLNFENKLTAYKNTKP